MIAIIVLAAVIVVMLVVMGWFYVYSRTPEWGASETRRALLQVMVMIGPIFGMHYRPSNPEPTTISAPGPDPEPVIPPRGPAA